MCQLGAKHSAGSHINKIVQLLGFEDTLQYVEIVVQVTIVQSNVGERARRKVQCVGGVTCRCDSFYTASGRASWKRKGHTHWILRVGDSLAGGCGDWVGQWGTGFLGGRSQEQRCMDPSYIYMQCRRISCTQCWVKKASCWSGSTVVLHFIKS